MKNTKTNKYYEQYRAKFKEMRRQKLVKSNERMLTKKQFNELAEQLGSRAIARDQALQYQNKLGGLSKRDLNKIWKQYQESKKVVGITGKNKAVLSKEVTTKFRSKETLVKNLKANQLIQLMMQAGITKEEALEEYGY